MADEEVYRYAGEIEIPDKHDDKLAYIVANRFNEAVRWQGMELVGGKPLRQVLRECYDQFNGILSPRDREIADEIGADAYVNLTAMKSGLVSSYLLESLVQPTQIPWAIEPTPQPDLSPQGENEAINQFRTLMAEAAQAGIAADEDELIRAIKRRLLRAEFDVAKERAGRMEKLMADQLLEGGWNRAMYGFATDFAVYPFAVLQGPVPVCKPRPVWSDGKFAMKDVTGYEFQSISPWDFWWTPDSPDTQRGTGVFIRQRWTRRQLLNAARLPSYREQVIETVLKETERPEYIYHWMSPNPDQPDNALVLWRQCATTIDVLIHYGYFSGAELRAVGVDDVEDIRYYNAQVTVIGKHAIQAVVMRKPGLDRRPVFTASFYTTHDRIPSFSIPQRIRDVERCYLISLRYLVVNAAMVSGPIVEADYQRLSKYLTEDGLGRLVPNTVYLASNDIASQTPALRMNAVPSAMPQYQALLTYFMDLVDRVSNIPAALHGTAIGSGVNRTFRGAAMLQGNAVKAIQAAVGNIDEFVFGPMGELLYYYNMTYGKDEDVQGDCRVLARGATGLLQREIDRQNSYEILQLVGSAGQQIGQLPRGMEIITWALQNVLRNMGAPEDLLGGSNPPPQPQGQEQLQGEGQGQSETAPAGGPGQPAQGDAGLPSAQ